jgi:mRNA interferase MazF
MKQKEIYWADLEPIKGREQGGHRPIVIISGDTMNKYFDIVVACPISSQLKHYENVVNLPKNKSNRLKSNSEIITFQVCTISKKRLGKRIGRITDAQLREIFEGLMDTLTY